MRRTISAETWSQIRTAHAAGVGLRELARNMNIPAGTVLARAKREEWTRQVQNAKALAVRPAESPTVTPTAAAAMTMQARGERHVERMAGVTERGVAHVEGLDGGTILDRVDAIEKLDKIARRTFGLNDSAPGGFTLNLGIVAGGMFN